jgi:hypothetical protein
MYGKTLEPVNAFVIRTLSLLSPSERFSRAGFGEEVGGEVIIIKPKKHNKLHWK